MSGFNARLFQSPQLQKTWFNVKLATWLKCLIVIAALSVAAIFIAPKFSAAQSEQQSNSYYEDYEDDDEPPQSNKRLIANEGKVEDTVPIEQYKLQPIVDATNLRGDSRSSINRIGDVKVEISAVLVFSTISYNIAKLYLRKIRATGQV